MSNERTRGNHFATGPDSYSDDFASEGGTGGSVAVVSGVHAHREPLAGLSVRRARAELEERLNIAPDATAVVDGEPVDEDTILTEGQVLNFVKHSGEKGSRLGCTG